MASIPALQPAPAPGEVRQIAAISDPVIRNLRITECYARLSAAMGLRVGGCSNWCTFATWASRQAGCTIRGEDFMDRLADRSLTGATWRRPVNRIWRAVLRRGILNPHSSFGRVVKAIHSPFDALERASDAVARGNLKVFAEIGLHFAEYLAGTDLSLKQGPPPDGQDLLRSAFKRYTLQRNEDDPRVRAQLVLVANLEIGLHEQTRLQPEIQEALEAVPDTKEDLVRRTAMTRAVLWVLSPVTRSYRSALRELVRQVVTESLMVLRLPGKDLSLGRHLDAPVPEVLATLDLPELAELLRRYEPHSDECTDCGAADWASLDQRMHYILHLFRAFHEGDRLFEPPFEAEQTALILHGTLPEGRL